MCLAKLWRFVPDCATMFQKRGLNAIEVAETADMVSEYLARSYEGELVVVGQGKVYDLP